MSEKPTVYVKLHRWKRSPYALGEPGEHAVEILNVSRGTDVYTPVVYTQAGQRFQKFVLRQSRVRAYPRDCYTLLAAIERCCGVAVKVVARNEGFFTYRDKLVPPELFPKTIAVADQHLAGIDTRWA